MLLTAVLTSLGLLFAWGALAPRHQWHALVSWTRENPRLTEPGPVTYLLVRVLSLAGILAVAIGPITALIGTVASTQPPGTPVLSVAESVWGQPRPVLVDRVFTARRTPETGLIEQAITGYQVVDATRRVPGYLFDLTGVRDSGIATRPGFLGVVPRVGSTALTTAALVVHVRGDDRCVPQQVVVSEAADRVKIGVFFGQARNADGSVSEQVNNCDPNPPQMRTRAFLIPVDLASPLGDRRLRSLNDAAIATVPLPPR